MRLICPNCDAQYEVDVRAIPVEGRDVQCSNCGHTWLQLHPDAEPADVPEPDERVVETPAESGPAAQPPQDADVKSRDWPDTEAGSDEPNAAHDVADANPQDDEVSEYSAETAGEDEDTGGDEDIVENVDEDQSQPDDDPEDAGPAAPRRRELDTSVAALLREEAARETQARRAESAALESQTEFGLDSAPGPTASRLIRSDQYDAITDDPKASEEPARRSRLPDIEEINSTLRAAEGRGGVNVASAPVPEAESQSRGFRFGFGLTLLIGLILLATYAYSPQIVAQVPGAEPAVRIYVGAVDSGRLWLDGLMQGAIDSLGPEG